MTPPEFHPRNQAFRPAIQLPPIVRYYDDFRLVHRSVPDLTESDIWPLDIDGETLTCNFTRARDIDRPLLKRWVVDLLLDVAPTSAHTYFHSVLALDQNLISDLIDHLLDDHPSDFRLYWLTYLLPKASIQQVIALRSICRTFCKHGYGQWTPDHLDFVSALKGYALDKYAVVRRGDCFVTLYDQSRIAQSLDDLAAKITEGKALIGLNTLRGAMALILGFQHGLRSGQIARIKASAIKIFPNGAVHIRFPVTKQRKDASAEERIRSIRREWCPIFTEFKKRRPANDNALYFIGCTPSQIVTRMAMHLREIGVARWSLTDLRHTAAQRLVDSGASHLAVSEFMNHADLATALVYFKGSSTQAERINKALGASQIYSVVAEVARTGIISRRDLENTSESSIISGMPHGVPIVGIGACKSDVSLCTRNPVISCYMCHKFLALSEAAVHEEVARTLRQIVLDFAKMTRPGESSPAMTQLRGTLEAIELLIDQLQEGSAQ